MILNCCDKLLNLESPKVMGILNLTPDSFYDGGELSSKKGLVAKISKMQEDGATIIDVGGMSSKPGASIINSDEEWGRIEQTIQILTKDFPDLLISVDTIHSETAIKGLDHGVHIINDISGGEFDKNMYKNIATYHPAYIMMHMRGNPLTMQSETHYENLVLEVIGYFKKKLSLARKAGIKDVILDPGFGFSKTIDQNYKLLNNVRSLKIISDNILVGISRKSMIYKVLDLRPKDALNGTSVLHLKALQQGAKILRVHDVKEAKETITLFEKLYVNK